jgi:general secretion pathway protein G
VVVAHCWARRHGGFTLIEVTVVMSLIVILSTIAVAGYRNAITRSREAVLKQDLFQMRDAIDQYYADKQQYPLTLGTLVTDGYLRSMPLDPFTNSTETWEPILAELNPNDLLVQGVFDVRTTYEGTALDGTMYADW